MGAAYNGFRDQYNGLPGDLQLAQNRLANCAAPCNNGDGNGIISVEVGTAPAIGAGAAGEGTGFFLHMLAAGLITGLDGTNGVAFGQALPTAPIGGGFMAGDLRVAGNSTGFTDANMRPAPYVLINGVAGAVAAGTGVLTAAQAGNIDRRLDDGIPISGTIHGQTSGANTDCEGAAGVYAGADDQVCVIAYRL